MGTSEAAPATHAGHPGLRREVGFIGLIWASEGSIIGSGWLFGAPGALAVVTRPRSSPGESEASRSSSWGWCMPN